MKMDDLISREEALKVCDKYNGQGYVWSCIRGDIEKLPPAQPQNTRENTCEITRLSNDSISRQAAIDEVLAWLKDSMSDKKNGKPLTERLKDLPSAQPTQPNTSNVLNALDTIYRQAAIDTLEREKTNKNRPTEKRLWMSLGLERACEILRELPSAQPEIIRCGGCKYRRDQSETTAWLPCRALIVPDDFSCIRAERREE